MIMLHCFMVALRMFSFNFLFWYISFNFFFGINVFVYSVAVMFD